MNQEQIANLQDGQCNNLVTQTPRENDGVPDEVRLDNRSLVWAVHNELVNRPGAQDGHTWDVRHYKCAGIYAREGFFPAGMIIVGDLHKHEHLCTIVEGRVRVLTEFGLATYTAPYTFVSEVGTKRIILALEDTLWINYFATDLDDMDMINSWMIAKDYSEIPNALLQNKEGV